MLMRTNTTSPPAVNTKDESFFKELGQRIALARKEQGITQVQLAATLGIAQQTLAHYEGGRLRLPASLLPTLSLELHAPVDVLLGQEPAPKAPAKRGPPSRMQQRLERLSRLPQPQQRLVMDMLDAALGQPGR
jgi:transcriptional regulator with XRE-family HTH domain